MMKRRNQLCCGLLGIGLTVAAGAQTTDAAEQCAAIADATARLACYDAEFSPTLDEPVDEEPIDAPMHDAAASEAQPTADDVIAPSTHSAAASVPATAAPAADAEPARTVETAPMGQRGSDSPSAGVSEQTAIVSRVTKRVRGQHVVYLENGQVWQENFASSYFPVESGDEIMIKKRRFGGYRLVSPSGKGFRVERVH